MNEVLQNFILFLIWTSFYRHLHLFYPTLPLLCTLLASGMWYVPWLNKCILKCRRLAIESFSRSNLSDLDEPCCSLRHIFLSIQNFLDSHVHSLCRNKQLALHFCRNLRQNKPLFKTGPRKERWMIAYIRADNKFFTASRSLYIAQNSSLTIVTHVKQLSFMIVINEQIRAILLLQGASNVF